MANRSDILESFLEKWPIEKLQEMTLQEYSNLNKSDSFCYWLEAVTYHLGSIWGGSAFKFGIYEKNNKASVFNSSGRLSDDEYAWMKKYGESREDAFTNVKKLILETATAGKNLNISAIDSPDLGDAVKWKIAYLYSNNQILNIFNKVKLLKIANILGIEADKKLPFSQLQQEVLCKKPEDENFFDFASRIWDLDKEQTQKKYWIYSPGEQAYKWDEFYEENIMALGWDKLGDLNNYQNKNEIQQKLVSVYESDTNRNNDAVANFDFLNSINIGDVIIVKKGRQQLLGYGIVDSDYYFDDDKEDYKHCRNVQWESKGNWQTDHTLVMKTLTDITSYNSEIVKGKTYYQHLLDIIDSKYSQEEILKSAYIDLLLYKKQIILQGPPGTGKTREAELIAKDMLGLSDIKELENNDQYKLVQFHPSYTYEDFVRGIVAKPNEDGNGITYDAENKTLGAFAKAANVNFLESRNSISTDYVSDFKQFVNYIIEEIDDKEKFMISDNIFIFYVDEKRFKYKGDNWTAHPNGLSMNFAELQKIISLKLHSRKEINKSESLNSLTRQHATYYHNLLELYKTFIAENPVSKVEISLKNYVLIIDEINRANLSSVLGELIYALEYRGEEVESMYEVEGSQKLIIPPNLYIIGTMNTADRSVGHIDYAIRRRFAFVEILPEALIDNDDIYFNLNGFDAVAALFNRENVSNEFEIKDVQIGHSYFIAKKSEAKNESERDEIFKMKMQYEVVPILEEYVKDGILINDFGGKPIKEYIGTLKS